LLGRYTLVSVTRIYDKFQTVIPAEIRKEFNLDKSYKIELKINDEGKVELEFIKKLTLDEMVGRYTAVNPINSVELKNDFKNGKL
jgi:AbrB family looped-hinge helix DNA binding protein